MNHRHFRPISITLIIALFFTLLPQPLALHRAMAAPPSAGPPEHSSAPEEVRERIGEIESMRDRNKKYYLNSDDTVTVEVFGNSVHYKNNGRWVDIDNTIIEDEPIPELPLRNKANDFTVRFARNFSSNNALVSVRKDQYNLTIIPLDAASATAQTGSTPASVLYKNIYPEVDLEYKADSDWVKEDIILNSYTGQNTFSFELKTAQLTPVLKDGQVHLLDGEGNEVFTILPPSCTTATRRNPGILTLPW